MGEEQASQSRDIYPQIGTKIPIYARSQLGLFHNPTNLSIDSFEIRFHEQLQTFPSKEEGCRVPVMSSKKDRCSDFTENGIGRMLKVQFLFLGAIERGSAL